LALAAIPAEPNDAVVGPAAAGSVDAAAAVISRQTDLVIVVFVQAPGTGDDAVTIFLSLKDLVVCRRAQSRVTKDKFIFHSHNHIRFISP
jgi:hypothetical protein